MGVAEGVVRREVDQWVDDGYEIDELIELVTIELVRSGYSPADLTEVDETVRRIADEETT